MNDRLPVSSAVPAHIAERISDQPDYRGEPSQEAISAKVAEIIDRGKFEPGDLMDLSDCCSTEAEQLARFAKLRFVMSEAIHRQKPSDYETLGRVAAEMCRDTFYDEAMEQL